MEDIIIAAISGALEGLLGFPVRAEPQAAKGNTASLVLYLTGISAGGERPGKDGAGATCRLTMTADFRTSGTHRAWLSEAVRFSRRLSEVSESGPKAFTVTRADGSSVRGRLLCIRQGSGQFVYDEDDRMMPATYIERFSVTADFPACVLDDDDDREDV